MIKAKEITVVCDEATLQDLYKMNENTDNRSNTNFMFLLNEKDVMIEDAEETND